MPKALKPVNNGAALAKARGFSKRNTKRPRICKNSGVALIIVVFAMLVLGVLGWSLTIMQSTDFVANIYTFDSENALNLAETGAQWALNQLYQDPCWKTRDGYGQSYCGPQNRTDSDCLDTGDWLDPAHNFSPGQYSVCSRFPVAGTESGEVVIESRGYIPSQNAPRTMRRIKLMVDIGSLTKTVQTQPADPDDPQKGLFDWSKANNFPAVGNIHIPPEIEGAINAGHYEADNDGVYDELGTDYKPPPAPLLPDDRKNPKDDIRDFSGSYPQINMKTFYDLTDNTKRWPAPYSRDLSFIPNPPLKTLVISGGNKITVNTNNFFAAADQDTVAIRRADAPNWWIGERGVNWTVITDVRFSGTEATVNPPVAWPNQTPIKLVRYFESATQQGIWYIGGSQIEQEPPGESADTIIDVTDRKFDVNRVYIITEGDTLIKGAKKAAMAVGGAQRYPSLATKTGNIYSLDIPEGNSEDKRRKNRQFEGLIYSQDGEINLNYLDGMMVYGNKIFLDGTARIEYEARDIPSSGFIFKPITIEWREE